MYLQSLIPVRLRLIACLIVLTLVSNGCGLRMGHRLGNKGKACYQQVYGVEDTMCHGYEKTCWRSWNQDVWSTSGCPANYNTHPAPVTSEPDVPVPAIPLPPETGFIDTSIPAGRD